MQPREAILSAAEAERDKRVPPPPAVARTSPDGPGYGSEAMPYGTAPPLTRPNDPPGTQYMVLDFATRTYSLPMANIDEARHLQRSAEQVRPSPAGQRSDFVIIDVPPMAPTTSDASR